MTRDGFVFYRSFADAANLLDEQTSRELLSVIVSYGLDGVIKDDMSPICKMAFTLIKPQIDANNKRYVNGKKGGAPSGNQNARKQPKNNQESTENQPNDNLDSTENQPKNNQKQPKEKEKEKDKEKEKEKVKEYLSFWGERKKEIIEETFLFSRYFKNYQKEAQLMFDCYESQGWKKSNGMDIVDIPATARMWQAKTKPAEYDKGLIEMFRKVYRKATDEQKVALLKGFRNIERVNANIDIALTFANQQTAKVFDAVTRTFTQAEWLKVWDNNKVGWRTEQ